MDAHGINLVATLGTAIGDAVVGAVEEATGLAGAAPAGLAVLLAEPGLTVDAFARTAGLTGSGGVRLVDRLTSAGLVERRTGRNGREVSLWLTPTGQRTARGVLRARETVVQRMVAPLDRAEEAELVRLSEKLVTGVIESRDQAEYICRLCDVRACPLVRCPVERALS